jgi:hypothetical protein
MKLRLKIPFLILSLGLVALTACSSKQPPTRELALAESAVEKASRSGGYEYAPLELRAAQEKLTQARLAIQDKQYVEAQRLLEQARVDARLAEEMTGTVRSRQAVEELQKSIDLLNQELKRSMPQ